MRRQCWHFSQEFVLSRFNTCIKTRQNKEKKKKSSFDQIRNHAQVLHPGLTPGLKSAQRGKTRPLYVHANMEKEGRKRGG